MGDSDEAWKWYEEVLRSDIYDTQGGTTKEGIHTGVMGGSINIALKAYAGISLAGECIAISPKLPPSWTGMKFTFLYKGNLILTTITKQSINIYAKGPKSKKYSIPIAIQGKEHNITFNKEYTIQLRNTKKLC
jgi:trehalose/maltose hydrolase-like predicted phosphorylase